MKQLNNERKDDKEWYINPNLKLWHGFEPRLLEYSDIRIQRPNQLDHRSLVITDFTVLHKPTIVGGYCSLTRVSTHLERCKLPSSVVSTL